MHVKLSSDSQSPHLVHAPMQNRYFWCFTPAKNEQKCEWTSPNELDMKGPRVSKFTHNLFYSACQIIQFMLSVIIYKIAGSCLKGLKKKMCVLCVLLWRWLFYDVFHLWLTYYSPPVFQGTSFFIRIELVNQNLSSRLSSPLFSSFELSWYILHLLKSPSQSRSCLFKR